MICKTCYFEHFGLFVYLSVRNSLYHDGLQD